jgi:hypothetical protein
MQLGRSPVSVADLVRAGLLRPGQRLLFTAAMAAGGTATNGWLAWYRGDGSPTQLADLRKRMLDR